MNKIIAFTGMPGAGKSEAVKFLENKNFTRVYFGGATLDEIKKRGLEINEKNEKLVREELRKEHGMAAYAIINLDKIQAGLQKGDVVIDGLYSWSEYKVLEDKFKDNFFTIAIVTDKAKRYQRLSGRKERPLTKEEVMSRDYAEIENLEKGGPIAIADYTIINNGSLEDLNQNLEEILNKIKL